MKLYLADLVHNAMAGGNVITGNLDFTVPLNVGSVGAYVKKIFQDDVDLALFKYADELLEQIDESPPTVVGFSNYAWNAELNAEIGRYIKEYHPEVMIVMGGPGIRTTRDDVEMFLKERRWIDAYVMYEGEGPFVDLLSFVQEHGSKLSPNKGHNLGNIAYLDGDEFFYSAISARDLRDPDDFPSPYLTGLMDKFLDIGLIPLFETNRGCPFSCTFCDWGISSMNKVRRFSMDRVFDELEYVAQRAPGLPAWIFADANFGILKRDIEIAEKIKEVRKGTGLQTIITWDSKNTYERNAEIAQILGRYDRNQHIANTGMAYVAVQNLSTKVLKAIKRDNINLEDLFKIVKDYHRGGVKVTTDVLYCLPSETYEDALATLRQCFDIGFDYINIQRTLMLPGSEMETDESRDQYGLRTKFMIRRGSYGDYVTNTGQLRAMEYDEVITSTPDFTEEEALTYHVLQWLVFYSWNNGRLSALFRYMLSDGKVNPIDLLVKIMEIASSVAPNFAQILRDLKEDIKSVMFESPEDMREHFYQNRNWDELRSYIRVELKYNAMLFGDSGLHSEWCDVTQAALTEMGFEGDPNVSGLMNFTRFNFVDLNSISTGSGCAEHSLTLSGVALSHVMFGQNIDIDLDGTYDVVLRKPEQDQKMIGEFLLEHNYKDNPTGAIERLLGARYTSAIYECHIVSNQSNDRSLVAT